MAKEVDDDQGHKNVDVEDESWRETLLQGVVFFQIVNQGFQQCCWPHRDVSDKKQKLLTKLSPVFLSPTLMSLWST